MSKTHGEEGRARLQSAFDTQQRWLNETMARLGEAEKLLEPFRRFADVWPNIVSGSQPDDTNLLSMQPDGGEVVALTLGDFRALAGLEKGDGDDAAPSTVGIGNSRK